MTTIFVLLIKALQLYTNGLLIYVLMSWVPIIYNSSFGRTFAKLYEPLFDGIRSIKFLPTSVGMLDFTPIIAILLIELFQRGIYQIFQMMGM